MAFTRNPATGENVFYGEWLPNAQGEDVVAGIRTPDAINDAVQDRDQRPPARPWKRPCPRRTAQLLEIRERLEQHYRDMQDVEFTVQDGRLWMLQTRTGKRNGPAAVRMAVEMAGMRG